MNPAVRPSNRSLVALAGALFVVAVGISALPAAAQTRSPTDPEATPEDHGAHEGRIDGRQHGLDVGQDRGRAQALLEAWLRGFRSGLTRSGTWRRDASWDEGLSEGRRPGLRLGLETGQERGRAACADAYLRLEGRPALLSEAAPEPPPSPAPPLIAACLEPSVLRLRLTSRITQDMHPRDCADRESPLGWDVPKPKYPEHAELRQRARDEGFQGDAAEAWIRGYKQLFRDEFTSAFRTQREMVPGQLLRQWEDDGETEGRREGERRRACESFQRGWELGYREGFGDGFERGFVEGWDAADARHSSNPVVRILSASFLDASDDGVIEPGEGVLAEIALANAGLRPASGDVLSFEAVTSLAARGAVQGDLPAQSRRIERLDLGSVPAGAPYGAGIVVRLDAERGDARVMEALVGRPVILESAPAALGVADGRLVARVRAEVANVSRRDAERDLSVHAEAASSSLGVVGAGERRGVELVVPVGSSSLVEGASGSVELRSGDDTWMRRDWSVVPRFGDALVTASGLPAGSALLDEALTALSRRLMSELARAMNDPKLYARLDDGSDLSELARVRASLPAATRAEFESRLARPLMERAEAKGTPRKVRRAIREALGRGE